MQQLQLRNIVDTLAFWDAHPWKQSSKSLSRILKREFLSSTETNPFGRCEPDRVIKTTINKDTKTPGGRTDFSIKTNAVDRWTINASYRASFYSHLLEFLGENTKKYVHTDLQKSRIWNEQDDVTSTLSIIEEYFIEPFSENPLLRI